MILNHSVKDSFLVCASALRLEFHNNLDVELFRAYVEDWQEMRTAVQVRRRFVNCYYSYE